MTEPIFYRTAGSGPPLVLVHGDFSEGQTTWSGQLSTLAANHRLIVVDRRGHGGSPRQPRPFTIAGDAVDVVAVADDAAATRFHLAGHSYGALVAIEIARREPERVQSLHLIEPPYLALLPDDPAVASLIARGREIRRNAAGWGTQRTAEEFFAMLMGQSAVPRLRSRRGWATIVEEAARIAHSEPPDEYPPTMLEALPANLPITIFTGGNSHPGLRAIARRLAVLLPQAHLIEIPNIGHAVQNAGAPFDSAVLAVTLPRDTVATPPKGDQAGRHGDDR